MTLFPVQAVTTATMHGTKLCFTDMPTDEEARLAQLPHLNTFTAMQLISFAYNESLDLAALLNRCQHQETLEQACSGVPPSMIRSISGSLQQLQETLLHEDLARPPQELEPAITAAGSMLAHTNTPSAALTCTFSTHEHTSTRSEELAEPGNSSSLQCKQHSCFMLACSVPKRLRLATIESLLLQVCTSCVCRIVPYLRSTSFQCSCAGETCGRCAAPHLSLIHI